jgi:hypothetical protein
VTGLAGIPITDDDGPEHWEALDPTVIAEKSIGRVLNAFWKPEVGELWAEAVIDVQRGLDAIARGVVGVSASYDGQLVEEVGEVDGARYDLRQVKRMRAKNVVVITLNPRHVVTVIQADSEGSMVIPDEIKPLIAKMADADPSTMLMELIQMLLAAKEEGMGHKATADALRMKYEPASGAAGDPPVEDPENEPSKSAEVPAADPDDAKVEGMADALTLASELGISVDPVWTLRQVKRAIVVCRGVPQAQADSLTGDNLAAAFAMARALPMADAFDRISARLARTTIPSTSTHGE